MSNIAGKAYAMNVLTPMSPWRTWIQITLFMVARGHPAAAVRPARAEAHSFRALGDHPAQSMAGSGRASAQSSTTTTCCSCRTSTAHGINISTRLPTAFPSGLDLFWYASTKYPHSIPISTFKSYISANQIQTNYYYNATPGAAQRDIKAALRVRRELLALAEAHRGGDAAAFAKAYRDGADQAGQFAGARRATRRSPRWRRRMPMPPAANSSTCSGGKA